jgi:hypothetical protein
MAPTLTPDRQTFRATVAQVAERAKAILPQEVNGRLEGAVALVLQGDVWPQDDGSIQVGSCTDPAKVYRLVGATCECKDFTDGKAPQGWCRHRIAAGLHRRIREILPIQAGAVPAPQALPEAPASVNVRLTIAGRDCQLTLRDHDEVRLLARLEEVLQRFPAPAQTERPLGPTPRAEGWCSKHGVQMTLNTKEGRSWYSHRMAEGEFCKGK